jgi:phosphoglycolate phosphatase
MKMKINNVIEADSIIFDLDGTLWNSAEVVLKVWKETIDSYKEVREPITQEILQSFMGLQLHEIGEKFLGYLEEDFRMEILRKCCEIENDILRVKGGILYPELESTLKKLATKYPLFIVSNCECGYIEAFLEAHKLGHFFKDFECPGNTGQPKAENIKSVVQRNNLKKPIYIGDTQGDCNSAKKAGVPFVYAAYGFGKVEEYEYVIEEIKEIITLLK